MRRKIISRQPVVMLFGAFIPFIYLSGGVQPALSATLTNRAAISEYEYAVDKGTWVRNALKERYAVIGQTFPTNPVSDSQQHYLQQLKNNVKSIVPEYVDWTYASNGDYNGWFSDTNNTWFPMLTTSTLVQRLNLPTNFFDYTPWRAIDQSSNEWDGLKACITSLVWTVHNTAYNYGTNYFITNNYDGEATIEIVADGYKRVPYEGSDPYYYTNRVSTNATGTNLFYDCAHSPYLGETNLVIQNAWNFDVNKDYSCVISNSLTIDLYDTGCEEGGIWGVDSWYDWTHTSSSNYILHKSCDYEKYILDIWFQSVTGIEAEVQMYERIYTRGGDQDVITNEYSVLDDGCHYADCSCSTYCGGCFTEDEVTIQTIGTNVVIVTNVYTVGLPQPFNTNYNTYYTRYAESKDSAESNVTFSSISYELVGDPLTVMSYYSHGYSKKKCAATSSYSGITYTNQWRLDYKEWYGQYQIDNLFYVQQPAGLFKWNFDYK